MIRFRTRRAKYLAIALIIHRERSAVFWGAGGALLISILMPVYGNGPARWPGGRGSTAPRFPSVIAGMARR
jgi:hypothetical protein